MKNKFYLPNQNHHSSVADAKDGSQKISRNISGKSISRKLVSVTILILLTLLVTKKDAGKLAVATFPKMTSAVKHLCFGLNGKANQHVELNKLKLHISHIRNLLLETGRKSYGNPYCFKGKSISIKWKSNGNAKPCRGRNYVKF